MGSGLVSVSICAMPYAVDVGLSALLRQPLSRVHSASRQGHCAAPTRSRAYAFGLAGLFVPRLARTFKECMAAMPACVPVPLFAFGVCRGLHDHSLPVEGATVRGVDKR